MCRHQNARQNYKIRKANNLFENVVKFKHVGNTGINRNYIRDENESKINSGIVSYQSVQYSYRYPQWMLRALVNCYLMNVLFSFRLSYTLRWTPCTTTSQKTHYLRSMEESWIHLRHITVSFQPQLYNINFAVYRKYICKSLSLKLFTKYHIGWSKSTQNTIIMDNILYEIPFHVHCNYLKNWKPVHPFIPLSVVHKWIFHLYISLITRN